MKYSCSCENIHVSEKVNISHRQFYMQQLPVGLQLDSGACSIYVN